jgi:hypothetical protein
MTFFLRMFKLEFGSPAATHTMHGPLVEHWPRDIATPDFLKREAMDGSLARLHGVPSPYPTTAFPLLVPVALMPWRIANLFWWGFEMLSFLVLLVALLRITKAYVSKLRASMLVLAILPLAPIHTAFAVENIVVVAIALSTAAVLLEERGSGLLAAVLLACGTAVLTRRSKRLQQRISNSF